MTDGTPNLIDRDESGNISSMMTEENESGMSGVFGLWPFPLLSAILSLNGGNSEDNTVVVTEIHRDENGRIKSIEEVKK